MILTNATYKLHGRVIVPFRLGFSPDSTALMRVDKSGTKIAMKKKGIYKIRFTGELARQNENVVIELTGCTKATKQLARGRVTGKTINFETLLEYEKGAILQVSVSTDTRTSLYEGAKLFIEYVSS